MTIATNNLVKEKGLTKMQSLFNKVHTKFIFLIDGDQSFGGPRYNYF